MCEVWIQCYHFRNVSSGVFMISVMPCRERVFWEDSMTGLGPWVGAFGSALALPEAVVTLRGHTSSRSVLWFERHLSSSAPAGEKLPHLPVLESLSHCLALTPRKCLSGLGLWTWVRTRWQQSCGQCLWASHSSVPGNEGIVWGHLWGPLGPPSCTCTEYLSRVEPQRPWVWPEPCAHLSSWAQRLAGGFVCGDELCGLVKMVFGMIQAHYIYYALCF